MGLLEASLFRPIRAVDVIKWLCVVGGVGLGVLGIVLKLRKYRRDKVHTINEEGGKEFSSEESPKSALKPETINTDTEILDPFYIKTEENEDSKGKIINGVILAATRKSISTMTTPNISRPGSISNLDVNQLFKKETKGINVSNVIPMNKGENNLTISSVLDNESFKRSGNGVLNGELRKTFDVENVDLKDTNLTSENDYQYNNLSTDIKYPSPKIGSSLEHQMSFNNLTNTSAVVASENAAFTKEHSTSHDNPVLDKVNTGDEYEETNYNIFPLKDAEGDPDFKSIQNPESQTIGNPWNHGVKVSSVPVENVFGDIPIKENPKSDSKNNNSSQTKSRETLNGATHPFGERQQIVINDENKPSDEEIKAVEEDINKLMSEMAELLPRNKKNPV